MGGSSWNLLLFWHSSCGLSSCGLLWAFPQNYAGELNSQVISASPLVSCFGTQDLGDIAKQSFGGMCPIWCCVASRIHPACHLVFWIAPCSGGRCYICCWNNRAWHYALLLWISPDSILFDKFGREWIGVVEMLWGSGKWDVLSDFMCFVVIINRVSK